jgi:DNA replication protein DnaC
MSARTAPAPLPEDLEAGLKRLKLSAIRRQAPELLLTAKTQRWTPEETLRVLVELEIAARDQSNCRHRLTAARFPVDKTIAEFHLAESSIARASHDYLITLDWIRRADNLCLVGPAGTGKTHYLISLGRAAVEHGYRVRYFTAVELIEQLWRAVADNTVGRTIETICRHELIIIDLCRPGNYADPPLPGEVLSGRGERVLGIVTGFRGRRAASRTGGSGPAGSTSGWSVRGRAA